MSPRRRGRETLMEKIPFTPQGLAQIKKELAHLKGIERQAVINAIAVAREHGDLSENAEYHAAREKQSFIEGRISELEDVTSRAEVIDAAKLSRDRVTFGTTVGLVDEDTDEESSYHIVGPYETDLTKQMISTSSPIARAVVGKGLANRLRCKRRAALRPTKFCQLTYLNATPFRPSRLVIRYFDSSCCVITDRNAGRLFGRPNGQRGFDMADIFCRGQMRCQKLRKSSQSWATIFNRKSVSPISI